MDLAAWDEQYCNEVGTKPPLPHPLLVKATSELRLGRALDLACGTGRNALWLAQRGWSVTAVDGSASAIDLLRNRAAQLGVTVDTQVADLEADGFSIAPAGYDLIAMCYYFQRNLIEPLKHGVVPGAVVIVIALLIEPGKCSPFRLQPGELRGYFDGWEIVHDREGVDPWQHHVAEIVARRPASGS
ncbi:MAG: methyltransferase domain-containing protein [Acidobacteriota bacterium]